MPRLSKSNAKGRQQTAVGARQHRNKVRPDDTYKEQTRKKRKSGAKSRVPPTANSRRKKQAAVVKDDSTTSGGSDDEDEEDEDDDDAGDEDTAPKMRVAPKVPRAFVPAPRYQYDRSDDNLSEIDPDAVSMFGDGNPEKSTDVALDDEEDDDDEFYQQVENISDSDPDNVSQREMSFLEAELEIDGGLSALTDEDPSFYLNQIEGMSAYGFGENSDAEGTIQFHPSSPSVDGGEVAPLNRHVRFQESFPEHKSAFRLSESPTMTRALLPSALPLSAGGNTLYGDESEESADFDSDVTQDCLPDDAEDASDIEDHIPDEPSPSSKAQIQVKIRQGKGPPTGTFIDEGDKSAGILDASGKMLIITNPHHLGEEFARRYGTSAPASPSYGFAEAVFGDEASQSASEVNAAAPDPMISSLNGISNIASNGQAMGPPEAWYADLNIPAGILLEDDETDFEGLDMVEREMRLEDVIAFGTDDSEEESPTSPAYMSGDAHTTPRHNLSHLNTRNLMAFRRGTDPAYLALQSSPPAPRTGFFATPKPPRSKKRKVRNESPYSTPIYKGVTPVQRTTRSAYTNTNVSESPAPSKRRRTMV